MYYGEIKKCDIANGPGVRVSLFVSGCTHHCKGCFNEETWDFHYGQKYTDETENQIIEWLKPDYISGFSILGGEPLEYVNQKVLLPLIRKVRKTYPQKTIWCYSGYTYEKEIISIMCNKWKITKEILSLIDVLVDGPFIEEKKNISLLFRGSENQRLIDVPKSLKENKTILWES